MDWTLRNDLPIYSQLIEQLKRAVVSGELPPGARLASVRELAADAGVNPNTMQRALQELERDGIVYAQRTAGRFVTEDAGQIEETRREMALRRLREFRAAMEGLGYDRAGIIALLQEEKEETLHADPGM